MTIDKYLSIYMYIYVCVNCDIYIYICIYVCVDCKCLFTDIHRLQCTLITTDTLQFTAKNNI